MFSASRTHCRARHVLRHQQPWRRLRDLFANTGQLEVLPQRHLVQLGPEEQHWTFREVAHQLRVERAPSRQAPFVLHRRERDALGPVIDEPVQVDDVELIAVDAQHRILGTLAQCRQRAHSPRHPEARRSDRRGSSTLSVYTRRHGIASHVS
jgi:hypothetical protein